MYKIEKKPYGYKITFGGTMLAAEMAAWVEETKAALVSASGKFGNLIDMRTLAPLQADAQALMVAGQQLYKQKGMERSAVILQSASITMQFKLLAQKSGIYAFERYLDASKNPNWEKDAENWLISAKDPDKK